VLKEMSWVEDLNSSSRSSPSYPVCQFDGPKYKPTRFGLLVRF